MEAERRQAHDSVFLELTRSVCPVCRRDVEAEVVAREGKVYLRKQCADHGAFEALVYGDAERYVEIQRYNKPGDRPLRLQTEMLDAFVEAEGEPEAIQLSGGEPSIHPQILDMLAAAKARGIKLVMLNTNGIRLARDPRFAPALAEIGVHLHLQF